MRARTTGWCRSPLKNGVSSKPSPWGALVSHDISSWFPMLCSSALDLFRWASCGGGRGGAFGSARARARISTNRPTPHLRGRPGCEAAKEEVRAGGSCATRPSPESAGASRRRAVVGTPAPQTLLAKSRARPRCRFTISARLVECSGVARARERHVENERTRSRSDSSRKSARSAASAAGPCGGTTREQKLNQLRVGGAVRDQFGRHRDAAHNRPDVLDPALLRRGRFDTGGGAAAGHTRARAILQVTAQGAGSRSM